MISFTTTIHIMAFTKRRYSRHIENMMEQDEKVYSRYELPLAQCVKLVKQGAHSRTS